MAKHLRALAAFPGDLGLIPSTHVVPQASLPPFPRDPMPYSDFGEHQTHNTYTSMQAKHPYALNKRMNPKITVGNTTPDNPVMSDHPPLPSLSELQQCACVPGIPALGRWKQGDWEFKVILGYISGLKIYRVT